MLLPSRPWRQEYATIRQGEKALEGMQRLLATEMGVLCVVFLTAGRSWYAYRGLDFHMRCMTSGMPPPQEEAHFLLNAAFSPEYRRDIPPEEWWRCTDLQSYGQRWKIADWCVRGKVVLCVTTGHVKGQ